jgi:hypothetical protein
VTQNNQQGMDKHGTGSSGDQQKHTQGSDKTGQHDKDRNLNSPDKDHKNKPDQGSQPGGHR